MNMSTVQTTRWWQLFCFGSCITESYMYCNCKSKFNALHVDDPKSEAKKDVKINLLTLVDRTEPCIHNITSLCSLFFLFQNRICPRGKKNTFTGSYLVLTMLNDNIIDFQLLLTTHASFPSATLLERRHFVSSFYGHLCHKLVSSRS